MAVISETPGFIVTALLEYRQQLAELRGIKPEVHIQNSNLLSPNLRNSTAEIVAVTVDKSSI